ncbi:hypothetical protein [Haliscomenobacter sp.]|uniref:hypothetical protein n=1 Tax=Haliscomenobacter sp. TaxID=2717303 RepID=UPI003364C480
MATAVELQAEIRRLQERYRIAQNGLASLNRNLQGNQAILARYTSEVATIPGQVAGLEAQINAIQTPPPATASQAARDDASRGPNAPTPAKVSANGRIVAPDTITPTNADTTTTSEYSGDQGLDGQTRTTEQTQATNGYDQGINVRAEDGTLSNLRKNPETGELYNPGGIPGGVDLTTEPGVAAPPDDAKNNSTKTVQANANAASNALKIQSRPNPLDQFASYTYSISVYLLSASQYERLLRSKTKKIDGYFLLFQDGGAPVNRGGEKQGMGTANISASDSGRNPFFPYDYYIDSLTLDTSPLGKATGASHMTATMKLVVNEANGITLIDNLYSAVANLQQKDGSGKVNYTAADYLAVIRFYGQGADGNPVQVRASGGAAIEKFIPFKLAAINWSIGSKMVTYEWDCVPQGQLIAGYTARGSVPHDMQITSTSVGKLLGGDVIYTGTETAASTPGKSTTSTTNSSVGYVSDSEQIAAANRAPPKAIAAPTTKKSVTQGLMGALTEFQEELTRPQKGQSTSIFDIADRYFIKFVDGIGYDGKVIPASAIENAKITIPQNKEDKARTASGAPLAGKNGDTQGLDQSKQAQDNMSRSFSITAGQMITQAIELAIRNSTYILDQALVKQNSDGYQVPNTDKQNSPMTWFNIIMNAVPRPGGIDPKRNDHAFDITYTIKPYRLQNFNSKYFPPSRFAGVHKSYPYWFTGQNTAVLEYQETMNALYSITVSGSDPKNSAAAKIREAATSSLRDIAKYNYAVTSGQSTQGSSDTRLNETAANAADYLFSPGDLANAKVKILGDPDWIQQGSLFKEIKPGANQIEDITGFGEDGSISFETGDVLFEIVWQRPEDYDLNTGVADPYGGGYSGRANKAREPIQSRVYQAVKIISEFRQGAFYQTIEGTLYQFPLPSKKNTVNAGAGAVTSDSLDQGRAASSQGKLTQAQLAAAQRAPGSGSSITSRLGNQTDTNQTDAETARLNRQSASSAGALGAQQASGKQPITRLSSSNAGVDADTLSQNVGINIRPAGPPGAATDGDGNPITVSTEFNIGPPKLPGVSAGQDTLTDTQLAQLEDGIPAGGDDPTSSTNPSNQDIATDGG